MWNGWSGSFSPMSVSLVATALKAVATIKKSKKDVLHA
jgi:hypothetical protein